MGQLRDAFGLEVERLRNAGRSQEATESSKQGPQTIAYKDANLIDIEFDKWKGLQVSIEFDQPPAILKMSPAQRRDWWENSKQLQVDSLLCLVNSEGGTIFLSAAQQINARDGGPTTDLNGGNGTPTGDKVAPEGNPSQIEPRNLFNHPRRAVAIFQPGIPTGMISSMLSTLSRDGTIHPDPWLSFRASCYRHPTQPCKRYSK